MPRKKGDTKRVVKQISLHIETDLYLRQLTEDRQVPFGIAVDLLYQDWLQLRQRVADLEERLAERQAHSVEAA